MRKIILSVISTLVVIGLILGSGLLYNVWRLSGSKFDARSQLLLLDEPLSNLNSDLKSTLLEELSVLQRRLNVTTLYVTHDKSEASSFAHSVVRVKNGQILMTCEE